MIKSILNKFKRKFKSNTTVGKSNRVIINGKEIDITEGSRNINISNNISIIDNKVFADGKEIGTEGTILHGSFRPIVHIEIIGNAGNIECSGNVTIKGGVDGVIDCGGSITVEGDVKGDIDCGGSIEIKGNHIGKVDARGSVSYRINS